MTMPTWLAPISPETMRSALDVLEAEAMSGVVALRRVCDLWAASVRTPEGWLVGGAHWWVERGYVEAIHAPEACE